jgi:VanZ family protein
VFLRSALFVLWCLAIVFVIVGSLSQDLAPPSGQVVDKIIHAGTYFFLAFLGWAVVTGSGLRWAMTCFLFCLGAVIEVLQAIIGGREASVLDLFANAIGIIVAVVVFRHVRSHFALSRYSVTVKPGNDRS